MPKYLSGRVKRRDQAYLSTDRYQYLGLDQAEPNLGDPADPLLPVPPGSQFQIVSLRNKPGERFWVPVGSGIIPGSISVFDEGVLVGTEKSITQLNFVGDAVTADAVPLGIAATITVAPPGPNNRILYKDNGDFQSSQFLVFKDNVGIGSVGIGTNDPTENLHIVGNLRLESAIVDEDNFIGNTGDVLVKTSTGGLKYTDQRSVKVSAAGSITQVQFHDSTGLLGGADNFVFDFTNNRIGIGSTQPDRLLDVLGDSRFVGVSTFSDQIFTNKISNIGIITSNMIHLTGGSFTAPHPSGETKSDTAIVVNENFGIYSLEITGGGNDDRFLRSVIQKDSDVISIGQDDTNLISAINIIPGNSGTVSIGYSGTVSLVGASDNGASVNVEKLRTTNEGVLVSGGTTTGDLRVTGFGTFENRVAIGSHLDMPNDARIRLGLNDDLQIYHETSGDTVIHENGFGDLVIRSANLVVKNSDGDNTYFTATNGGSVDLFHNNNLRFKTTGFGVTIFETTETQQLKVSGVSTFQDNIFVGTGATVGFGTTAYFKDDASAVFGDDEGFRITRTDTLKSQVDANGDQITLDQYVSILEDRGDGGLIFKSNGGGGPGAFQFFDTNWRPLIKLKSGGSNLEKQVLLYYNKEERLSTTNEGILVSGGTTTGTLSVTGVSTFVGVSTFNDNIFVEATTDTNQLNVSGVSTFKDDVEFHGASGIASITFDKSANELNFKDNVKLTFGDDGTTDSEIYFNGQHLNIRETSPTGALFVDGHNIFFRNPTQSNETYIKLNGQAADRNVELYHQGEQRLETTKEGIIVSGGTTTGTLNVTGVSTFVGNAEFKGNVSIAGTLTYEDVTNVDAIGLITARNGIHVTGGEVGIGTTTPNHLLHVVQKSTDAYGTGVAKFEYYDTDDTGGGSPDLHFDARFIPTGTYIKSFVTGSGTDFLIVDADNITGRHSFAVEGNAGNNKSFTVDSTGLVGIGTANPQSLLTLGASSNPALEFKDYTNNARSQILGSAGGQLVFQTDINSVNANSDFIFRADSVLNEIVRFKDTGEVGIGTNDPTGTNALTNNNSTLAVGIVTTNSLHTHDLSVSGVSTFQDDIFVGVGATVGFGTTAYFRDDANIILGDDEGFRINRTETLKDQTNSQGGRITFNDYVSIIEDRGDGPLIFKSNGGGGPGAFQFFDNGWRTLLKMKSGSDPSVLLYHLGEERLQTNEQGILVSGGTTTGTLSVTGVSTFVGLSTFSSNVFVEATTDTNQLNVSGLSTFVGNIVPDTTDSVDIGESESLRFNRIFAREIFAEIKTTQENQEIGTLKVTGVSTFIGLSTFANGIEVVSGTAVFDGNIDANGNLDVDGQTDLDVLNVAELATFEGNIDANADLDVDGHTELDDLNVSGFSTFVGNAEFKGNVSIAGTLTYEDVTNVDAIGLITARNGIHVTGAGVSVAGISTFINTVEFQDKVGIGTTNPQVHDLHVNGDAFVDGDLFLRDRSDSEVKLNGQNGSLEIYADGVVTLIESDHDKEMITFDINTTHNDGRIYFEGDKDTFLNHPGDNQLGLTAGGFEIIRITSDTMSIGNTVPNMKVGIGTDNPTGENALTDNNSTLAVGIITTNSSFTHDLKVSGVSTFAGITTVTGETLFTKQLNVSGISTFVGVVTTGNDLFVGGDIEISNANPTLTFTDTSGTPNNPDYRIIGNAGKLAIQDIQDSFAERFVISSGGLINIQTDLDIGRDLKVTGVSTFKDDVEFHGATGITSAFFDKSDNSFKFIDNTKLKFGDDEDLQIFHSGSNSVIKDAGTGSLIIAGNAVEIKNPTGTEVSAKFLENSSVELYFDDNEKLRTTNEGVLVSGGTTTGDLRVTGFGTFENRVAIGSHLDMPNDARIRLGDNDNLLIDHLANGDSRIIEAGSGNLYIGVGGEISNSTFNINVSNDGASGYILSGSDRNGSVSGTSSSGSEINVTLNVGDTVNFVVNASGHPFFIKTAATIGTVDQASGVTNNGAQNGTVSWTPDTVGTYYFICRYHGGMVGTITVQSNSASGGRNLNITEGFSANYLAQFRTNNSVDLYFNRNLKFRTTGIGISVLGITSTTHLNVTGVSTFQDDIFVGTGATVGFGSTAYFRDNAKAVFGDDENLSIYYDGSQSYIEEFGSGQLYIRGSAAIHLENSGGTKKYFRGVNGGSAELFFDGDEKIKTTNEGVLVSGGTTTGDFRATGVSTFVGISTFNDQIFTNKISNIGIITSNMIHLTGGSFTAPHPSGDTQSDTAIVVNENFGIYSLELQASNDNRYLRSIIQKDSNVLTIGQDNTSLYAAINIRPGNAGTVSIGQSGAVSLVGVSEDGYTPNIEKLRTVGTGITVFGNTETQTLNVTGVSTFTGIATVTGHTLFTKQLNVAGISTFNDNTIIDGSLTVGSNHSFITGGAPTDQGNLAVYGSGKNSLIIQTTSNVSDRGIAWRNSGDNYVAYIAAVNRGSSEADLRFGVSNNIGNVDSIPERMRITKEGNVGINSTAPIAKLDVDGSFHVSGNIGIGSTIPIAKLDVNGQTDLDVLNVSDTATFDANIKANGNIVGDNATAITGISRISGSVPTTMAVQNVQYVGRSNDPYAGSFLNFDDQNVPPFGAGGNFTTLASISGLNLIYDTNDNDDNGFVVGVGSTNVSDANAFTAHMVIDHTGKVGFGTVSPESILHIHSGTPKITMSDSGTGAHHRINADSSVGNFAFDVDYDSITSTPAFIVNIKGGEKFRINSEGSLLPGGSSQDIGADEDRWNTLFVNEVNASGGSIVVDNYETNILKVNGISTFIGLSTFADGIQVVSGIATFDGAIDANGGANIDGGLVVNSAKISDLTENRVVIVGSDGELGDSANLTFNGSLLNVTGGVAFSGDIDANANLDVDGHTELDNLNVSGVSTFVNNAEFKANVSIAGTLTYEDVTNVDAIGLITARNGIHVTGAGISVAGISTFINDVEFRSKIGIGTTNPQQELHIQNNVPVIRFTKENGITDNKHWNIGAGNPQILRIQAIRDDGGGGGQLFDFYRNAGDVEEFRGKSGATFWFTINNDTKKVGIGSTTPTEQLDVAGNINVGGGTTLQSSTTTGTGKALRIISPSGYIEVGSQNDNNAHFYTDRPRFYFNKRLIVDEGIIGSFNEDLILATDQTENRIRIKNGTGDVGIGQDDPTSRLHVTDSVDNIGIATLLTLHSIRTDMPTAQAAGGSIRFLNEDNNNKGQAFIQANCPSIYDNDLDNEGERERTVDFNFVQSNGALNTLNTNLTIKGETGNVGIGTTRPDGRLHVSDGNAIVTGGSFGIGTTNPLLQLDVRGSLGISAVTDTSLRTTISSSSGGLIINHGDNSPTIFQNAGIERVRFEDTGEVGINSTVPAAKLEVLEQSDNTYGNGVARFKYFETDENALRLDVLFKTSGSYHKTFTTGAGTDFLIVDADNSADRASFAVEGNSGTVKSFKVMSDGKVGIGTTIPNYNLHIIGTAAATNFDSLSDRKVKTNIQVIQNPIDKIKKIDGVSFNWKSDNKPSLGVIADNVEEVLPEIVSGDDPKSVNYNGLIGLLIEVVKDQQKQIDELRGLLDK